MKNLGFMAVVALLMMFGCAKDEVITDEQELFSVEKNSQPVIYGEKGPTKDNAGVGTGIWFKGTSLVDSTPLPIHFYNKFDEMQILSSGNFSGRLLIGYGKIDEIRSIYNITKLTEKDNGIVDYTGCSGRYTYNIEIEGTVYITDRNSSYFTFTLTGEFYTNHDFSYTNSIYKGMSGQEQLTGVVSNGQGKFLSWKDKPLKSNVWCDDLTTGIIGLNVN